MTSKLVERLNIQGPEELKKLTQGCQLHSKKIARKVILHNQTYEEAGEAFGITKHAVYEFLKRLYQKKYGVAYGKEKLNAENNEAD